ncbi:LOW QUALITY PROTEIN: F-box/FBD/LRR-repeat protein At5g56420-like [Prunus avium]|uniref:LOW QUALITY PROTEIN: F-box/FBD/LRR-repeat protein At5g56420-like n=1 Tax=Prunus avium TaxID=42229 RepID=A0A6P5SMX6_PRUAV|nr:LOW QUALITY PROTEIN: F-box/FBD/LRR-repeat protein At5g56420-like [Prunus avium]
MGSKSKPRRLKKKPRRQDSVKDRISELPDAILCHILSFIPTKYAVRTSILSTRWKRIWASAPILDFEYKDMSVFNPRTVGYKSESYAVFLTFVDHVLSSRDPLDIQKFRLHCYCSDKDFSRIYGWIRTVIRHNVVELDLHVEINNDEGGLILELPQCVFMCKTLEVLKVKSNCIAYAPPTSGCFPSLKFLHISVDYPDNDSMEKIFACCPVLECLTIGGLLGLNDVLNFNISVPQLTTLRLEFNLSCFGQDSDHTFFINCPKLESLDIKQDILSNYSFENVKSLVKANVNLWCHYVHHRRAFSNRATALLAGFSNVKYLSLSAHFLKGGCLPAFDNLSELKLVLHDRYQWDLLTELLQRSPNLEYLVLEHKENISCFGDYKKQYLKHVLDSEHRWRRPESVPVCLISHLKTVTYIRGYKGYPHEKKVAKYSLKKGQVLSKMTICNDLSKDFAMSRRASKACQVEFN